jgi:hypothetical protein
MGVDELIEQADGMLMGRTLKQVVRTDPQQRIARLLPYSRPSAATRTNSDARVSSRSYRFLTPNSRPSAPAASFAASGLATKSPTVRPTSGMKTGFVVVPLMRNGMPFAG